MADKGNDERNRNSGALFVNDKNGNDKRPDFTGKLQINVGDFVPDENGNVHVILAAWEKDSEKVGTFYSLKASPPKPRD